ncbi:hypothetical protein RB595_002615 [Gaeumannomyces hyphopodioides]
MPTTLILGGAGKLARQLTTQLLAQETGGGPPHVVHSLIRAGADPSQADELRRLGVRSVIALDLETCTVAALAAAIRAADPSPDVVVWCAGAPFGADPGRIDAVDHLAAVKAMDACAQVAAAGDSAAAAAAAAKRFVSVSMLDLRDREHRPVPPWYTPDDAAGSDRLWGGPMGVWARAKLAADTELCRGNAHRGLDFTIVRPGGLGPAEDAKGAVAAGRVPGCLSAAGRKMVSRADVAVVLVECIRDRATVGLAFDVVGGDEPVSDAVARVARDKEDTFQGFY